MVSIIKVLILTSIIAGSVIAFVAIGKSREGLEVAAPLQKLRQDLEHYDNWAVFSPIEYVFGDCPVDDVDERIALYVAKMLSEVDDNDRERWLKYNSWRYGFNYDSGRLIYVGVFAAEQMYYSGLRLAEYANNR